MAADAPRVDLSSLMTATPEPGTVVPLGDGMALVYAEIAALREQDVNAQVMEPGPFERLVENIRKRGAPEQFPYCHWPNAQGVIEIVSGHHRSRASRAAGLQCIWVIADLTEMRRSEVTAKAIAHNQLHGNPDQDVLRQLIAMIDNVDDLLTTGLPEDMLPTYADDDTNLALPHVEFDWRLVTMTFLPREMEDFSRAVAAIESSSAFVGIAPLDLLERFAKAMHGHSRLTNTRSIATTVYTVTMMAEKDIATMELDGVQPGSNWTRTAHLIGPQIPPEAGRVVQQALDKAIAEGDVNPEHPWQLLELLAADYLAGAQPLRTDGEETTDDRTGHEDGDEDRGTAA